MLMNVPLPCSSIKGQITWALRKMGFTNCQRGVSSRIAGLGGHLDIEIESLLVLLDGLLVDRLDLF
jgi:hypothetical protein